MPNTTSPKKPDELAAPLDLMLTSAVRPFIGRMTPDGTVTLLGAGDLEGSVG
jgi:polyhydroxyalkanoate synthase subunit PhaC